MLWRQMCERQQRHPELLFFFHFKTDGAHLVMFRVWKVTELCEFWPFCCLVALLYHVQIFPCSVIDN